jgi:hypothetical protein
VSELLTGIRDRRQATAAEALTLLDLVPLSDTETRRSLLSMAVRSLEDPAVLERIIDVIGSEADVDLKEQMIARLAGIDRRKLAATPGYVGLMIACIEDSTLRPYALEALGGLAATHPEVVRALTHAYEAQSSAKAQHQILSGLCRLHDLPDELAEFLSAQVDRCDADLKTLIVDRLLRAGAASPEGLARWLAPTEPSEVKERVLEHLIDRSMAPDGAVAEVLRTEPAAPVRLLAVRALAAHSPASPEAVQALLDAIRSDTDDGVRAAALGAFQHSVQMTAEVAGALLAALRVEKSGAVAGSMLALLMPLASRSPKVRDGLLALTGENLRSDAATVLHAQLGRLLRWDAELLPHFLRAYREAQDDHLRAALLEALSAYPDQDEKLVELYPDALAAPAERIRRWGVTGLLMVPMSEDRVPVIATGAESLLDTSVEVGPRRALARKIARIPEPSPELRAALERVAAHADDEQIRNTCREALARAGNRPGAPAGGSGGEGAEGAEGANGAEGERAAVRAEMGRWYQQVEVEQSIEGIFPAVYAAYDADPALGARILRTVLLHPGARERLRQNPFQVDDVRIVEYLVSRDALDDDVCRYCVEQALASSTPSRFVAALRARPSFPDLADQAWRILEGARYASELNHLLLLELLVLASGGEPAAATALRARVLGLTSPPAALPYARLLDSVRTWPPAKPILEELLARPALLDSAVLDLLDETIGQLLPGWKPIESGPGLADD